jgi:tRNA threonylcarbamoyladenosine biosynthesis protein TsaE
MLLQALRTVPWRHRVPTPCSGLPSFRAPATWRRHGRPFSPWRINASSAEDSSGSSRPSIDPSIDPSSGPPSLASVCIVSPSRHSTAVLAAYFASASGLAPGDCYLLFGSVGAGKSHFSREFIRFAMHDEELEVPSPTYLLHNVYEQQSDDVGSAQGEGVCLHHYDLYRLGEGSEEEFARLELGASFEHGVSLIEWPERLVELGWAPADRVELSLRLVATDDGDAGSHREKEVEEVEEELKEGDTEGDTEGDMEGDAEEDGVRVIDVRGYGEKWRGIVSTLESHVRERGHQLGLEIYE